MDALHGVTNLVLLTKVCRTMVLILETLGYYTNGVIVLDNSCKGDKCWDRTIDVSAIGVTMMVLGNVRTNRIRTQSCSTIDFIKHL